MARWDYRLDVSGPWNDNLPIADLVRIIVAMIRASRWYKCCIDVEEVCNELEDCTDTKTFDAVWADVYDLADATRCWIITK